MHISLRILLVLLGFFACVLAVGLTVQAASLPATVAKVIAGVAVSASVLGLVHLLRRRVDRKPQDLVRFDRTAPPLLVAGIAIAAVVAVAGGAAAVLLGFATWGLDGATTAKLAAVGLPTVIISTVAGALLVQGFPEELVFRGYMFANLREKLPLWGTIAVTSVLFGSIHVVSNGGATTLGERLVYAVMATGFGLMLASCRTVSGSLWLGIGFHAGHNAFVRMFVTLRPDAFIGAQLVTFGALVVAALITFATARHLRASGSTCRWCRRRRWPRHGPEAARCRCGSPTTGSP